MIYKNKVYTDCYRIFTEHVDTQLWFATRNLITGSIYKAKRQFLNHTYEQLYDTYADKGFIRKTLA